jgi:hypothetical protein
MGLEAPNATVVSRDDYYVFVSAPLFYDLRRRGPAVVEAV